MLSKINFVKFI